MKTPEDARDILAKFGALLPSEVEDVIDAWERDRERLAEVVAQRDAFAEPARRWCEQSDDGSDTQLALRLSADAALAAIRAEREGA
jgi:hypothetical protein